MNIVYVSKTDNINEIISKWQQKLPNCIKRKIARNKVVFKKQQENAECKAFFSKPIKDKELDKIAKNIKDTISVNEYKNVVISNELKEIETIYNKLKDLTILDGRWLFNYLLQDVVNYILEKKKKEISASEISVLVNETIDTNVQNILILAQNVKVLNIVTNNIAVFKQIEEKLYEEKGIMIRVTNNRKKSLLKSDIIINLDFNEEELNKYNLPSKRNYSKCE